MKTEDGPSCDVTAAEIELDSAIAALSAALDGDDVDAEPAMGAPDVEWPSAPPWFRCGSWLLSTLMALTFAFVVMLQWGLWFIVTGNIISPWGIIVGIAIAAAQILLLFVERNGNKKSCLLPTQD